MSHRGPSSRLVQKKEKTSEPVPALQGFTFARTPMPILLPRRAPPPLSSQPQSRPPCLASVVAVTVVATTTPFRSAMLLLPQAWAAVLPPVPVPVPATRPLQPGAPAKAAGAGGRGRRSLDRCWQQRGLGRRWRDRCRRAQPGRVTPLLGVLQAGRRPAQGLENGRTGREGRTRRGVPTGAGGRCCRETIAVAALAATRTPAVVAASNPLLPPTRPPTPFPHPQDCRARTPASPARPRGRALLR